MNRPHFTVVGVEGGFGMPGSIARADGKEKNKAITAKHHFTYCMLRSPVDGKEKVRAG